MGNFDFEDFVQKPSTDKLADLLKDDWLTLADHYKVSVKSYWRKKKICSVVVDKLVELKVVDESAYELCEDGESLLEFKKLEFQEKAKEREFQILMMEKEIELKEQEAKIKEQEAKIKAKECEREAKEREAERKFQLEMLQSRAALGITDNSEHHSFDVLKCSSLVPSFEEDDVDSFFLHFEKVANSLKWPKEHWPALVQSVLTGKGRSTYLSLSLEQSYDYDAIKKFVSQAYHLTAENYRVKFRMSRKDDKQTYIEYAHTVGKNFDKWISAANVSGSFDKLREVTLLEQYLSGVLPEVSTYLMEREVTNLEKAASLAENYSLINRNVRNSYEWTSESPCFYKGSMGKKGFDSRKSTIICYGCKEPGHVVSKCPNKDAQDRGVVNLVNNLNVKVSVDPQEGFKPFQFEGTISASERDLEKPVRIMRDTCSSQSIILRDAMSDIGNLTKESVILSGIGGTVVKPLCQVYLRSELVSGYVTMAVEDTLEVDGVHILLGNDLAGDKVVPNPVVCFEPLVESPTRELEKENPFLFPSCVVTRSRANLNNACGSSRVNVDENNSNDVLENSVSYSDDLGNDLGNALEDLDSSLKNLFQDSQCFSC